MREGKGRCPARVTVRNTSNKSTREQMAEDWLGALGAGMQNARLHLPKHANLAGDVVPSPWCLQFIKLRLQGSPHIDDSAGHSP